MSKQASRSKSVIWTTTPSLKQTKIHGVDKWRTVWGRDVWSVMVYIFIALCLVVATMLIVLTPRDVTPEMTFFGTLH